MHSVSHFCKYFKEESGKPLTGELSIEQVYEHWFLGFELSPLTQLCFSMPQSQD